MACLWKTCLNAKNTIKTYSLACQIRHGHHLRGKNPDVAKSLQQRVDGKLSKNFYYFHMY